MLIDYPKSEEINEPIYADEFGKPFNSQFRNWSEFNLDYAKL